MIESVSPLITKPSSYVVEVFEDQSDAANIARKVISE